MKQSEHASGGKRCLDNSSALDQTIAEKTFSMARIANQGKDIL
jgi:hypothetical protein